MCVRARARASVRTATQLRGLRLHTRTKYKHACIALELTRGRLCMQAFAAIATAVLDSKSQAQQACDNTLLPLALTASTNPYGGVEHVVREGAGGLMGCLQRCCCFGMGEVCVCVCMCVCVRACVGACVLVCVLELAACLLCPLARG